MKSLQGDASASSLSSGRTSAPRSGVDGAALGLSNCQISRQTGFKPHSSAARWASEVQRAEAAADQARDSVRARDLTGQGVADWSEAFDSRENSRKVRFHVDGALIRLSKEPGWQLYENDKRGTRGKCSGFSDKSRQAMRCLIATLNREVLPHFLTLTYPAEFTADPRQWKRHLDSFGKRVLYRYPSASLVWKLEPQQRGAPHFHALVYGVDFIPWQWIALVWAEVVAGVSYGSCPEGSLSAGATEFQTWLQALRCSSGFRDHVNAGTRIERARSHRGVVSYCSKEYLGKIFASPAGWSAVGRYWGVIGRKNLPRSRVVEMTLSKAQSFKVRRVCRKLAESKGYKLTGQGSITLHTSQHLQFVRLLDWARGGLVEPIDFVGVGHDVSDGSLRSWFKARRDVTPF